MMLIRLFAYLIVWKLSGYSGLVFLGCLTFEIGMRWFRSGSFVGALIGFGASLLLLGIIDIDFDLDGDFGGGGWEGGWDSVGSTASSTSYSDSPPLEEVSGYTRQDGTQVADYARTKADGIVENNLSYRRS